MAQVLSLHISALSNEVCVKDTTNNAELQGILPLLRQHRRGDNGHLCLTRARRQLCCLKSLNLGSHRSQELPIGPNRTVIFSAGLNINLHDEQGDNSLSYYTQGTDIRPETKDRKFFPCLSGPILRMVPLWSDFTEYLGSTELFFFSMGVQICRKKS